MFEHARKQNEAGNDVVIVDVGGSGGSNFYKPNYIRVAEIEHGSEFTKINGKNVIDEIASYEYNQYGGSGPKSRYHRCMEAAKKDFSEATAPKAAKGAEFVFEKEDAENVR